MPELAPMQDRGWLGVDLRIEPHLLPPGYGSHARNMRFTDGVPETRRGFVFPRWTNKTTATGTVPWTTVHGRGIFSDPVTREVYLIIAADNKIYSVLENNWPVEMSLPAGESITGTVTFTQAGSRLICHRGFLTEALWLDDIHSAWEALPEPVGATGTTKMPNMERSIYFQGRLWGLRTDDIVAVSDFNDPSSFQAISQEYYVNPGSADRGIGLARLGASTVVIFKERSVFALYNCYGDLTAVYGDVIASDIGCVAVGSIVDVGNEVWFLSDSGVRALVEYEQDSNVGTRSLVRLKKRRNQNGQEVPDILSMPVQPLFDRVVRNELTHAVAAFWNHRYYLAIPLDDAVAYGRDLLQGMRCLERQVAVTGASYQYDKVTGAETALSFFSTPTTSITNSQIFTAADDEFMGLAAGPSAISSTLRRRYYPVNNAVLVYDFLNGAWSGYDESDDFAPSDLFTMPAGGSNILLGVDVRGWIAQYEMDYVDAMPEPWIRIELTSTAVQVGDTLQINSGDTITAQMTADNAAALKWGISSDGLVYSLNSAARNLYHDQWGGVTGDYGYYMGAAITVWSAPNTTKALVRTADNSAYAIDFFSTNGKIPTVVSTLHGAEITYHTYRHIESEFITRAHADTNGELLNGVRAWADVQTWAAALTMKFLADSVNEAWTVVTWSPSRTAWIYPVGATAYAESNSGGNAETAGREDYSILFGPDNTTQVDISAGVGLAHHQQVRMRGTTASPVNWYSGRLQFLNTAGRMRIMAAGVQGAQAGSREGII